jgi:Protein of unknown function (DUF2891)
VRCFCGPLPIGGIELLTQIVARCEPLHDGFEPHFTIQQETRHARACRLEYQAMKSVFVSAILLLVRVLPSHDFAVWLQSFLPQIPESGRSQWLQPVVSPDPSDPKLAHLDGLNLSRAWMLEGIAGSLPKSDKRLPAIRAAADAHKRAGLAAVTGEHCEGGHWLGSFAVYLVTRRGIRETTSTRSGLFGASLTVSLLGRPDLANAGKEDSRIFSGPPHKGQGVPLWTALSSIPTGLREHSGACLSLVDQSGAWHINCAPTPAE